MSGGAADMQKRNRPPTLPAHGREGIRKRWSGCDIPRRLPHIQRIVAGLVVREQGDQREQGNACRCCADNRYVIPLAVGFDTQMCPHGVNRRFQLPAENEPRHDVPGSRITLRPS
jgi:hypothetical protein